MKEEFRSIKGYEGLYEVSSIGNVKSLARLPVPGVCYIEKEKILKNYKNAFGYNIVS